MSFHGCPIEPSDWSHGDDPPEPNCPDCEGTDEKCETCGGTGRVEHEYDPADFYDLGGEA